MTPDRVSAPAEPRRELVGLTGLRGIAALWVVACHWSGGEAGGLPGEIARHGYVAVDLFMVLSGFVLAMTSDPPATGYGGFLWRRVCRLYPLYLVATLVCFAEAWATGQGVFAPGSPDRPAAALLSNLLLTDTHLWEVDAIDGPSWVVSVEFTLNLGFPLFMLLCMRPGLRGCAVVAGLCGAALVAVSVLDRRWNGGVAGALGTLDTRLLYLRCGPEFALGMLCWRFRRMGAWLAAPGPMAVLVLGMLAMTPFKALDLAFVAAGCLLVIGLAAGGRGVGRLLGGALPCGVGRISYGLYLWHIAYLPLRPAVAGLLAGWDAGWAEAGANAVGLAGVLWLSALSTRWLEAPARAWLLRLG